MLFETADGYGFGHVWRAPRAWPPFPLSGGFQVHRDTVAAWIKLTREPTFSGILGTRFGGEQTFDMKVNDAKVLNDTAPLTSLAGLRSKK